MVDDEYIASEFMANIYLVGNININILQLF